jgi:hypothetical protein
MDAWQPRNTEVARLKDIFMAAQQALSIRLDQLETRLAEQAELAAKHSETRRNRTWLVVMGIMTAIVSPVVVTMILALINLRN